jgi:DMSO/TMAO reductase YedYZ molybdopterin-dependent catalytic subunit
MVDTRELLERFLSFVPTGTVAAFAGAAALAGSYAAAGFTGGFVVAPIEGFLTAVMPGAAVTFAITTLGSLGQQLNLLMAFAIGVALFGSFGLLGVAVSRRMLTVGPLFTLVLSWATAFGLTGSSLFAVAAAVPPAVVVALAEFIRRYPEVENEVHGRREVLGAAAGVVGFSAVSYFLGSGTEETKTLGEIGLSPSEAEEAERLMSAAQQRSLGVDGLEPLVSEDFYGVDINSVDPDVDESEWTLTVTGEVEEEVTLTYDELISMEADHRFNTLRCVGEGLNGQKMDNALWTGVPIWDLVERAGPQSGCECVMLRAEDGYYEEFPLDAMRDGFLAYGMNGDALPRKHGYPARALIPGHWGEINVKWITEIEVLDEEATGYWEERGWQGTGPVITVAKLHAINDLDDGRKQVAGHAYAGTRGIEAVEVSTDGGETWNEAELSEPLPETAGDPPEETGQTPYGEDVWRQWKYEYDPTEAGAMVTVRARDGNGNLQPEEETDSFPSGPSGWVSRQVEM